MLGQDVFGQPTLVEGESRFWAYEIDTKDTIEESKKEIREKIEWFLKYADIKTKAEDFVESATMNPAFEESAMFENMIDLMFEDEYEVYVFDTAPTANARRLLGMSDVYGMWVNKMVQSREEAQSLKELLSYSRKEERDPLMEYLLTFRDRMEHAKDLLTDDAKTAFFFVTLPEALPIAVIKRFVNCLRSLASRWVGWWSTCGSIQRTWVTIRRSSCATAWRCSRSTWRRSGRGSTTCERSCLCLKPRCRALTCWGRRRTTCLLSKAG
jgi:arsenite-transporting ATPase